MIKFIHIADVHYGRWFSGSLLNRRTEIADTFHRIITFANDEKVDFLLCSGDLIDGSSVNLSDLYSLRDTIAALDCPFYAIAGNHDFLGEKSVYNKIKWPENFYLAQKGWSSIDIIEKNTVIHAHSWGENIIREAFSIPFEIDSNKINIMMLHADTAGSGEYFPAPPSSLKSAGMDYIALGHIHKPCSVSDRIFYSGSPEPLDPSESDAHGFYLTELDRGFINAKFIPFSRREFISLSIEMSPGDSLFSFLEKLNGLLAGRSRDNIYTIRVSGKYKPGAKFDMNEAVRIICGKNMNISIIDETVPDYDIDLLMQEYEGTIAGRFIKSFGDITKLSRLDKDALIAGIDALISPNNNK